MLILSSRRVQLSTQQHLQLRICCFSGDAAAQRSLEATNKLLTVLFLFVATLLGLQAIGLDIQSVLAISGFGGLALGLAGREILENVFNGLLIVSSRSFVVGEEIMFTQVRLEFLSCTSISAGV